MKTIRIQKQENVKLTLFPDGQPHVQLSRIDSGDDVRVVAPIRSSQELLELLCVSNALDNQFANKKELVIPYLMGARSDRVMQPGDSVDLRVVSDLINSCEFDRVQLFDVHSDTALQLIKRSRSHNNSKLVKAYDKPDAILICPDAGAAKKIGKYAEWNPLITDVVHCIKDRDLTNGNVSLRVLEPGKCAGRNCVIIDDLCDGGATFLAIASQVRECAHLTLIVSHGIFSKGFHQLEEHFDSIITTDSYRNHGDSKITTTIALNL